MFFLLLELLQLGLELLVGVGKLGILLLELDVFLGVVLLLGFYLLLLLEGQLLHFGLELG